MASTKKIIREIAELLNVHCETKKNLAYGVFRGFSVVIYERASSKYPDVCVLLCASYNGAPVNKSYLQNSRMPGRVEASVDGYRIELRTPISGKNAENVERVIQALTAAMDSLNAMGCVNCDEFGVVGESSTYSLKGGHALFTDVSAEQVKVSMDKLAQDFAQKKENPLLGTVGAFLGALAGSLLIFLIARLGRISVLCSVGMCFATVFGYKKLGKKFTIISSVICAIVSIGMTYFTFRLDAAITVYTAFRETAYEMSIWNCFLYAKQLFELADAVSTYDKNCILMMLAGILGTVLIIAVELWENKRRFQFYKY